MRSGNSSLPVVNRCALHMEIAHPQTARTNGWLSCADKADDIMFIGKQKLCMFGFKKSVGNFIQEQRKKFIHSANAKNSFF